jgi:MFS family permease
MATSTVRHASVGDESIPAATQSRSLLAACLTHALHDGYTDGLHAFLPVWQAQVGLPYAALAVVRALYFATMGGLQIPADRALRGLSPRAALILATIVAAAGFAMMALLFGFVGLCVGLVVAGIGSSIQHPRASMIVTDAYGAAARRPLGIYNFSGDLRKAVVPAIVAVLLPIVAWRPILSQPWWTRRSMTAMAVISSGKTCDNCSNARFIVGAMLRRSYRCERSWKGRSLHRIQTG